MHKVFKYAVLYFFQICVPRLSHVTAGWRVSATKTLTAYAVASFHTTRRSRHPNTCKKAFARSGASGAFIAPHRAALCPEVGCPMHSGFLWFVRCRMTFSRRGCLPLHRVCRSRPTAHVVDPMVASPQASVCRALEHSQRTELPSSTPCLPIQALNSFNAGCGTKFHAALTFKGMITRIFWAGKQTRRPLLALVTKIRCPARTWGILIMMTIPVIKGR